MKLNSPFQSSSDTIKIEEDTQIVFVSDMFIEQYSGGAELTTEALIEKSPVSVQKILASKVSLSLLEQGHSKHWIFGIFCFTRLPALSQPLSLI